MTRTVVEAPWYLVRCPYCRRAMLRIVGNVGNDEKLLYCCGHVYREPMILLEDVIVVGEVPD